MSDKFKPTKEQQEFLSAKTIRSVPLKIEMPRADLLKVACFIIAKGDVFLALKVKTAFTLCKTKAELDKFFNDTLKYARLFTQGQPEVQEALEDMFTYAYILLETWWDAREADYAEFDKTFNVDHTKLF